MRNLFAATLALATLGSAASSAAPFPGTPYYFDPISGAFAPARPVAKAVSIRTGKIVVTVTLAIEASIPADAPITCSATASLLDPQFTNNVSTSAGVIRTAGTGKCTLTIPYEWTLSATTDNVVVSFSVSSGNSYTVDTASHTASHSFTAFAIPATGTTTSLTLTDSL